MRWMGMLLLVTLGLLCGCTGDTGPAGPQGDTGTLLMFYDQFDSETIGDPWELTGDALWFTRQNQWSLVGPRFAVSGDIDDNQTSTISVTSDFSEPALVYFIGSVDSEPDGDWFTWRLDGREVDRVSGTGDGGRTIRVTGSFPIPVGTHTIEWSYEKNDSITVTPDRAALHAVMILNWDGPIAPAPAVDVTEGGIVWSKSRTVPGRSDQ